MRDALDDLVLGSVFPSSASASACRCWPVAATKGQLPGLGWIEGRVKVFGTAGCPTGSCPLPHMGWNDVRPTPGQPALRPARVGRPILLPPLLLLRLREAEDVAAVSSYGGDFACAVNSGNIYGVQFHPEKSHHFGTRLLKNFAEL